MTWLDDLADHEWHQALAEQGDSPDIPVIRDTWTPAELDRLAAMERMARREEEQ